MNHHAPIGRKKSQQPMARWVSTALICALGWVALPSLAQTEAPLSNFTVDQLVSMLRIPPGSKAIQFQRTHTPDVNHRCKAIATSNKSGKNLVVDYDPGHSVSVNMALQFADGRAELQGYSLQSLSTLALALADPRLEQGRFAIAGHASRTGDEKINRDLSCARAIAVRDFLVSRGVAGYRLDVFGFGSDKPLAGSAASDDINRRVEIRRDINSVN